MSSPDSTGSEPVPTGRPLAEGVATLDGGRTVSYAEYGSPGGTPVVFLHGTPGSRRLGGLFHGAARDAGVRLLAPDRPGYGESDPWPARTLADTGAFVAAVLDAAGVRTAGVVGFSGGGPHALAAAATLGDRVRDVDVVAGTPPPSLGRRPPTQRALAAMAGRTPRLLRALLGGQAWVARRAPPAVVVSQYATAEGRDALAEWEAELVRRDFVEAVGRRRSGAATEFRLLAGEWEGLLDRVDRRVRLWHGGRDANVPVAGARRLSERIPDARLTVFEGADHLTTLLRSRARVPAEQRRDAPDSGP